MISTQTVTNSKESLFVIIYHLCIAHYLQYLHVQNYYAFFRGSACTTPWRSCGIAHIASVCDRTQSLGAHGSPDQWSPIRVAPPSRPYRSHQAVLHIPRGRLNSSSHYLKLFVTIWSFVIICIHDYMWLLVTICRLIIVIFVLIICCCKIGKGDFLLKHKRACAFVRGCHNEPLLEKAWDLILLTHEWCLIIVGLSAILEPMDTYCQVPAQPPRRSIIITSISLAGWSRWWWYRMIDLDHHLQEAVDLLPWRNIIAWYHCRETILDSVWLQYTACY